MESKEVILSLREKNGLSQEELAQRVLDEIGVEIDWGQPIEYA